ncbi:MAG: hypothetical protein B7733_23790 [Myxococcales bacterium FL481]|nr:MAG: hypothetical protein B7733_23790 [Myxococcales bacterium FL481]
MLRRMIRSKLDQFENEWDYSMDYMREVLDVGPLAVKRFYDAARLDTYARGVSSHGVFAAKIRGVMAGDCGPCVQLVVDMAAREGVPPAALRAIVAGDWEPLPTDLARCARFADALAHRRPELDDLRDQVRASFGRAGLVTLAYAVMAASLYPTLKYALGHGQACSKIRIGDLRIAPTGHAA